MSPDDSVDTAIGLMDGFADRTGLTSDRVPVRYLWTDAFAVCNYLGLRAATDEDRFLQLATALVDQVHWVLGRHRPDDSRDGWISGLSEQNGLERPTAGGLRIGKLRDERAESEPYRPAEEWDRDGQYYHYLTKWMFALGRMGSVTGDPKYHRWGIELARAAHAAFVAPTPVGHRMYWKMSIDLSRPLVPSTGHHDPLDGLVTMSGLLATGREGEDATELQAELAELAAMGEGVNWSTTDPLGAGGLLVYTLRCAQLARLGHPTGSSLFATLLGDALLSLQQLFDFSFLRLPAERRLAFRELGLALGLLAIDRLGDLGPIEELEPLAQPGAVGETAIALDLEAASRYQPIGQSIVEFWSDDRNRTAPSWTEHRDISDVMWATCLVPAGFLDL